MATRPRRFTRDWFVWMGRPHLLGPDDRDYLRLVRRIYVGGLGVLGLALVIVSLLPTPRWGLIAPVVAIVATGAEVVSITRRMRRVT